MANDTTGPFRILLSFGFLVLLPISTHSAGQFRQRASVHQEAGPIKATRFATKVQSYKAEPPALSEALLRAVGSLFIFGIPGSDLNPHLVQHIQDTRAGSFILFKRNLVNNKQVTQLTGQLHALSLANSGSSALIGVDQEGGRVARIPFSPPVPSAFGMAAAKDPAMVEELSFQLGRALRQLGFNMNFAPVLDLGTSERYSFLGLRSFSPDPSTAAELGSAFAKGQQRARVLPVAKHFPGIGPIPNDPHVSLVRRPVTLTELRNRDLIPFESFAQTHPSAMMISHLIYPQIDVTEVPGTFSSVIVKDLLKSQLKFRGLVVTDDLMMAGAQATRDFKENVLRAFEAGADLMMISWSEIRQRQAIQALLDGLRTGRISQQDVIERSRRVLAARDEMKLTQPPLANDPHQLLVYNFKAYESVVARLFERSVGQAVQGWTVQAKHLFLLAEQSVALSPIENGRGSAGPTLGTIAGLAALKRLNLDSDSLFIYFIRNKKEADLLASFSKSLLSRTLAINRWRPDFQPPTAAVLPLFVSHPSEKQWLSHWLIEQFQPKSARLLPEPAQTALSPILDLPKSRLTNVLRVSSADLARP